MRLDEFITQHDAEDAQRETDLSNAQESLTIAQNNLATAESELAEALEDLSSSNSQVATLTAQVDSLNAQVADLQEQLDELQNPPVNTPGAVANATATADTTNNTIRVVWSAPSEQGSSPVTGYDVFRDQPDWTGAYGASTFAVTLINFTTGNTYAVKVRAKNSAGPGPWTTFNVTMGGSTPPAGTGFKAAILATNPEHYYPLNSQYSLVDLGVDNSRPLTNAGGVTFTPNGAVFDGSTNDYLTADDSLDFAISSTKTAMAFFVAVTFPTYNQDGQFHWMSKGGDQAGNYAWAMRLYGDSNDARARNISAYYWNPNPSYDINGNPVSSRKGSGAYLAPPAAAPDYGGYERHNGPVHSGEIGVEHYLGVEFTYAGTNGYAGRCRLWYGDQYNPMTLLSDRPMNADALVTPVYTNGRVFIGKRGDNDGYVKATIRRLAFWNRQLSQTEWRSFANETTMAKGEDS